MAPKSGSFQVTSTPVTILAHLLALAITALILVWVLHFREGLAFNSDNKMQIFNLHPLFMVVGFIIMTGEGIMAYKSVPAPRKTQKTIHFILHLIALACGIVGIVAVFKYHNELNITNLYSLHSWFGISTISLFGLQWLLGLFTFLFPGAAMHRRAAIAPWHIFMGMIIFIMAVITAETGLIEKFIFTAFLQHAFGLRSQEALLINFTGLLIFLFAIFVSLAAILPRFRY